KSCRSTCSQTGRERTSRTWSATCSRQRTDPKARSHAAIGHVRRSALMRVPRLDRARTEASHALGHEVLAPRPEVVPSLFDAIPHFVDVRGIVAAEHDRNAHWMRGFD